jgi:choline dehydrogenase
MSEEPHDYIVVGSGSAGGVVASRVTESRRHRVLLVEAGRADDSFWVPIPLGMTRLLSDAGYAWLDRTIPTESFGDRSLVLTQGKMLGGSSSLNGMIYVRGQKEDYDSWAEAGCSGWSWADVLPHFKKSECLEEGGSDEHHGRHGELKVSWIRNIHDTSEDFLQATQDAGIPFNEDTNSGHQEGVGYLQGTIYKGTRQSTANTFLKAAAGRSNLKIMTSAHVRRVVFEGKRAVGVEVEDAQGATRTVRCGKEVILCAGAIGTPQILQHSGIGDGEHLQSLGIGVVADVPEVGRNLQDHLFAHLKFKLKEGSASLNAIFNSTLRMGVELLRWKLSGKGMMTTTSAHIIGFFKSDESLARPDLELAMRPFSFALSADGAAVVDSFPGITVSAINTRPFSRGEVKIQSANPKERAKIHTNYLSDHRDIELLAAGLRRVREIMKQPAIAKHVVAELEPGSACTSADDLEKYLRAKTSTVYHPVGTCRMGADETAVLDPKLRLQGIEGVRVIDASVMPTITSANPNAPCIMIGEKGADLVLADAD